jgi:hypothetical protein
MVRITPLLVLSLLAACADNEHDISPASPGSDATSQDASDSSTDASADLPPACMPVVAPPPTGPSGYPMDGWTWVRHGVVLEDSTAGSQDGLIAPAAVIVADSIHLWVTRKKGTQHRILHSVSTDGVSFSEPAETSGLAGQDIIAYPSVLHDGSRFLMWYGSGSIDHAWSSDGVAWNMIGTGVLRPGGTGAFDSLSVLYPSVVAVPDGYAMYYTGFDGQTFAIGRAESTDGATWSRSLPDPILTHGSAGAFDNHAVAQPFALRTSSSVLLWYGGYDTETTNPGPYRIGLAQSTDGAQFARSGLTIDLLPDGEEAWSTRDPAVVRWHDQWWMAYCVMGDDGRYRIAVATSETCAP